MSAGRFTLVVAAIAAASCRTGAPKPPTIPVAEARPRPGLPRFDTTVRVDGEPPLFVRRPEESGGPTDTRPASIPARPVPPKRAGERILRRADGRLTKFYSVREGRGTKFGEYIAKYCDLRTEFVEVLPKADIADVRALSDSTPGAQKATPLDISDWIVVTGTPDEIERVDKFLNLYYASVPQIEIEARIAEITSTDALDLGSVFSLERVTGTNDILFDRLRANFPNQSTGANAVEGALTFSTVQSESQLQVTLDFLKSRQGVDIISNPRIAVRNGGRAEIVTGTEIPFLQAQTIVGGTINSTIQYKVVGVKLFVVPYLAGSDTIALEVSLEVSAPTGLSSLTGTFPNPVISTRSAKTIVHVKDGNTFVIGGLLSSNQVETENRIPFLGDLPLLGALFRSSFSQKQYTEVLFFLTPRTIAEETPFADLVIPG